MRSPRVSIKQPPTDWSTVTNLGQVRAVPEVKETVQPGPAICQVRL